jgi:hypothetical protein
METPIYLREPLINSGSFSCVGKMPERRTVQIKTPIAGNSQSIAKIGNAAMRRSELAHFNKQMLSHELIRGSLVLITGKFEGVCPRGVPSPWWPIPVVAQRRGDECHRC